jgi:hypothetical protein
MSSNIREARIFVKHKNILKKLCKFAFSGRDASLYIFPYGVKGEFFYGTRFFMEEELKQTFNFKQQHRSNKVPKISIHQSGQVHVSCDRENVAGPLSIKPLSEFQGEHLATIQVVHFDELLKFSSIPKEKASEKNISISVDNALQSGKLVVYCNSKEGSFKVNCSLTFTLKRPGLADPIYFGIDVKGQEPLAGVENQFGVVILAGFDSRRYNNQSLSFLYVCA